VEKPRLVSIPFYESGDLRRRVSALTWAAGGRSNVPETDDFLSRYRAAPPDSGIHLRNAVAPGLGALLEQQEAKLGK